MSGNQEILREYLFSLGFKVDNVQVNKFDKQLVNFEKTALRLGGALAGAAAGAQAMVAVFASQMEKLYYASRRADASAGSLQGLEYAGKSVGLSAGQMTAAVEGLAKALRANPGLTGLLESLGVPVRGRDKADVLKDFVTQLGKMPFYVAQQYGNLFGIDADTLLMLQQGREEFDRMLDERKKLGALAGMDMDKAAEAGKEYMNVLRQITERLGLLKDMLSVRMLPAFKAWSDELVIGLDNVINVFAKWDKAVGAFSLGVAGMRKLLSGDWKGGITDLGAAQKAWQSGVGSGGRGTGPTAFPDRGVGGGRGFVNPSAATGDAGMLFAGLEQRYGLPTGLLDRMWAQESGRGKNMLSPKGAMGHFQFMPRTAKEFGLSDPYNLADSADAAARKMAGLLKRYSGDLTKALAAYNWGEGNLGKYGMSRMPQETLGYVRGITGVDIQQNNTYNIYGTDAKSTASAVHGIVDRTNADLTRNMKGALQ